MTLEEAIKHCEEKACGNTECAAEHKQLAEWLKELQAMKSLPSNLDEAAREKAREIFDAHDKYDIGEEKNRILLGLLELEAFAMVFYDKGAKWQKEQMMSEAVEGRIEEVSFNNGELHNTVFFSFDEESLHVENRIWFPRCGKDGDKVRIIICKKEDEK